MDTKALSRRNFLRSSGLSGTALLLGFYFPAAAKQGKIINAADDVNQDVELNAWLRIDTSGNITILSHRAEMGQGAYHAIPQIIAEELEVNLDDVNIAFAKGDPKNMAAR